MLLTMIKGERRRAQAIGNENEQRSKKKSRESYKEWTKERKEERLLNEQRREKSNSWWGWVQM